MNKLLGLVLAQTQRNSVIATEAQGTPPVQQAAVGDVSVVLQHLVRQALCVEIVCQPALSPRGFQ
jgi:hypothetical protein